MQRNLHVTVANEREASTAVDVAFRSGVTDVITFDYWSSKMEEASDEAREQALKAAQKKSKLLLSIFEQPPEPIEVVENTGTFFPRDMYRTYENILEEDQKEPVWRSDEEYVRKIYAYRPKLTFLDRVVSQPDVRPAKVMTRPEIVVLSTVTIRFGKVQALKTADIE